MEAHYSFNLQREKDCIEPTEIRTDEGEQSGRGESLLPRTSFEKLRHSKNLNWEQLSDFPKPNNWSRASTVQLEIERRSSNVPVDLINHKF